MVNLTQTVSPDIIDITPMVLTALFSAISYLLSGTMLLYNTVDNKKKVTFVLIGLMLLMIGFLLTCYIITNSINAGIEWQKLRM